MYVSIIWGHISPFFFLQALSSFFYSTDYMKLPYNGGKAEYWQKTEALCNTSYADVSMHTHIYKHTPYLLCQLLPFIYDFKVFGYSVV